MIANVGPLIAPTTKAQYQQGSVPLPPQLFSHNDQQDQWHSLRGKAVSKTGWAGRIADVLASQVSGQQLALNVSLSGNTLFQAGQVATPYIMGAIGRDHVQRASARPAPALARKTAFQNVVNASYGSVYERAFAEVQKRAVQYADLVNGALAAAPPLATVFPANSTLATQLQTVAKMIAVRERLGMSRQVFFVATGGFDTHDDQLQDQPGLLGNVSASLAAFSCGDRRARGGRAGHGVHAVGLRPHADVERRRQRSRLGRRAAGGRRRREGPHDLRALPRARRSTARTTWAEGA